MNAARDLICFSHLRWGFVFQRPNHLMCRSARLRRTFFVEEPLCDVTRDAMRMEVRVEHGVFVCTPHLAPDLSSEEFVAAQRVALDAMIAEHGIQPEVLWYYTPMALYFARHLTAPLVVYDCMDELSNFRFAPPELRERELELFGRAGLVFTGGQSLYQRKRRQHQNVYAFPSSVDAPHFAIARQEPAEPPDQAPIARPRIGYYGVIDERIDLELIAGVASERPEWQLVMVGPVVKIDAAALPRAPNIHWLGQKRYEELPHYLGGWDVAMMPFALNEATEFISPTKSLEYLAGGKPIVSTAIRDVVEPYGSQGLARIADADSFVANVESALNDDPVAVRAAADRWLERTSWDKTWEQMAQLMSSALAAPRGRAEERLVACSTT